MGLRAVLVAVIVVSTGAFVVGTTLERNAKHSVHESAATLKAEGKTPHAGESAAHRKAESAAPKTTTTTVKTKDAHAGESAAHRKAEGLPPETKTSVAKTRSAPSGQSAAHPKTERSTPETGPGAATGKAAKPAGTQAPGNTRTEAHAELKPFGVNIEAVPFIVLAAAMSLALAAAAWLRPHWLPLLLVLAATMLAFTTLDVREVFHQHDERQTGLAVLAGVVAALHMSAAAVAGLMTRETREPLT